MTSRTRALLTGAAGAMSAGALAVAVAVPAAAQSAPPAAPPVDTTEQMMSEKDMAQMQELMEAANPGMARMQELMRQANPGMIRMHEQMMSGGGMMGGMPAN
jgi:hypothetical protein